MDPYFMDLEETHWVGLFLPEALSGEAPLTTRPVVHLPALVPPPPAPPSRSLPLSRASDELFKCVTGCAAVAAPQADAAFAQQQALERSLGEERGSKRRCAQFGAQQLGGSQSGNGARHESGVCGALGESGTGRLAQQLGTACQSSVQGTTSDEGSLSSSQSEPARASGGGWRSASREPSAPSSASREPHATSSTSCESYATSGAAPCTQPLREPYATSVAASCAAKRALDSDDSEEEGSEDESGQFERRETPERTQYPEHYTKQRGPVPRVSSTDASFAHCAHQDTARPGCVVPWADVRSAQGQGAAAAEALTGHSARLPEGVSLSQAIGALGAYSQQLSEQLEHQLAAAQPLLEDSAMPKPIRRRRTARPLAPAGAELTAAERAQLERERNREHARNTRIRKKEMLATLQDTAVTLQQRLACFDLQRAADDASAGRRCRNLTRLVQLRQCASTDESEWAAVISHDFTLRQPLTPHLSSNPNEHHGSCRVSRGSAGAVADAVSLALFMRSVGLRGGIADKALTATPTYDVSVQRILEWDEHFECAASRCVAAKGPLTARDFRSDVVTLRVTQRTLDARDFGAQQECTQRGLLIATFDAADKILTIDLAFDALDLIQQVQRSLKLPKTPIVVPSSLEEAMLNTDDLALEARVITTVHNPHQICVVNESWLELCGFATADECIGRSLNIIQGPDTDATTLARLGEDLAMRRPTDAVLVNYRQNGESFVNYVRVFPLWTGGEVTHFLGVLQKVQPAKS